MRRLEQITVIILAVLLAVALVGRLVTRGGPYFERPETIMDHVGPGKHETRDALILLPKIRPLLPKGAEVTCFRPVNGWAPEQDTANYYTAVGMLPRQSVVPPFTAGPTVAQRSQLAEYVVAVRDPFTHPAYKVIAAYPEGRLYRVQR